MKAPSLGEETFELHCRVYGLGAVREFRFAPPRRWRFDFAFPNQKVGVEIEGGTWIQGRHNRGAGYQSDLEKYNAATKLGWKILRFTSSMVVAGTAIKELRELLAEK